MQRKGSLYNLEFYWWFWIWCRRLLNGFFYFSLYKIVSRNRWNFLNKIPMKKPSILIVITTSSYLLLTINYLYAEDFNTSTLSGLNIAPPPIPVVNWHKNSGIWNNRFIYFSATAEDEKKFGNFDMNAFGYTFDYSRAFSDSWGYNANIGIMDVSAEYSDEDRKYKMPMQILTVQPSLIFELIGGEEKDIAGEITKSGFSLSLFGGIYGSKGWLSCSQTNRKSGRSKSESSNVAVWGGQGGVVAEIPLAFRFRLVPFFSAIKLFGGKVNGKAIEDFESPAITSFGSDILVKPLKNNPNLNVSIGMLLQIANANKTQESGLKTTLVLLGIQYEFGKHYSAVTISPGGITR